ncbi:hypothetical protein [Dickeya zeae]|uniref:hypothetical protein n=1 Tax=Dickeya zeae TaxID=204042 RepID=UPI000377996F|nr:hypothetical protein [Dickeya zeae]UJR53782.1 hypothetical protein J417_06785 [Dickeya zeae MS1]
MWYKSFGWKAFFLISISLLNGCATTPVSNNDAKAVPEKRIISKSSQIKNPGEATLIVKRDTGFAGSGCNIVVYLDSLAIAELDTGEKVTFYAQAGDHVLSAKHSSICVAGLKEVGITLKENDKKTYRIGFGGNLDMSINATAF